MFELKSILMLADVDPSRTRVYEQTAAIAKAFDASVIAVGFAGASADAGKFSEALSENAIRILGEDTIVDAVTDSAEDPGAWIAKRCESGGIDLVVKTGNRSETLFYSPLDWHLIRELKVPVLILEPDQPHRDIQQVLATVDVGSDDPKQQALDAKVVEAASAFATRLGAELHGAVCIATSEVLSDLDIVNPRKREHAKAPEVRAAIDDRHGDLGLKRKQWHVHAGVPEKVLSGIAKGIKSDLVVVGTVGRKSLQGLLIGNTVEKLLGRLSTNVLVVKPD